MRIVIYLASVFVTIARSLSVTTRREIYLQPGILAVFTQFGREAAS